MTLMTRLGSLSVDLGIASPVTIGAVLGAGVLFYIIRLSFGNDSNSNACRNPKNHLGKCQPKRQSVRGDIHICELYSHPYDSVLIVLCINLGIARL